MAAVMERDTDVIRCHFCGAVYAGGRPGWAVRTFLGQQWHACERHSGAPFPSCETPEQCHGSCLKEFACDG